MDIVDVLQSSTAPQDATLCEDQSRDSEGSSKLEDSTGATVAETFFKPVTQPTKVLKDITGQEVFMKKPGAPSSLPVSDEELQENQMLFVKRKKRMLMSNTSFFAGCTPIKEA
ncbi:PREDICTED: chromosome-associated kinesin KIF4-like [Calidris pugnax]|uniref:chromosome-associated kinesin KIF4-like n=1 Tax=Calidris pugnax TaxID=198806 RepID=UPI00071C4BD4|nr:PREDICTED: chromosome-associated kinesin KIF4-like [Calidris pugnax]